MKGTFCLGSQKKKAAVLVLFCICLLYASGLNTCFSDFGLILSIYLLQMITLNVQVGVNPLINHLPISLYQHKDCSYSFTIGQNGQIVAWRNGQPIYQMCPSVNAQADKLLVITSAKLRIIEKATAVVRLITIHNDNRLRIWSQEDGLCLNVSTPQLFSEPIIALIAAPIQAKFIIALASQCYYIVDCWLLKIMGKVSPKKETYARFQGGSISSNLVLQIYDGNNRSYSMDISSLFSEHFLDFGIYINQFDKTLSQIGKICEAISAKGVLDVFKRQQKQQQPSLLLYNESLQKQREENLAKMVLNSQFLKQFPKLIQMMANENPSISTLHYIGGNTLFMFIGTQAGKLWGIPLSAKSGQDIVLICETQRQGHAIRYIRIFGSDMFVSWDDGWLAIYAMQNLVAYIQMAKINHRMQEKESQQQLIFIGLEKLVVLQERLSSYIKYSLPTYHHVEGAVRGTYFFRLDRNQIVKYDDGGSILHFRGISEQTRIYCVILVEDYVCICTSKGVQAYSNMGFERLISYDDWIWADFQFLGDIASNFQYRHSDLTDSISNAQGLLKFNSRRFFNLLDYYSDGETILTQTFGASNKTDNIQFPGYYFLQRGQVQKAFHSRSTDNYSLVVKMKLNRIRKDHWNNAAFIIHGNLNAELDAFITQRGNPKQIISKNYQFYQLIPWAQIPVPFLSRQMKEIGKRMCLKRRWTAQGVGKAFTIYFCDFRFKLSSRILAHEAISAIALLQCWVVKDNEVTDHMVEAVEYFAKLIQTLYQQSANIVLSKLAVSQSQHISKATINLLISKAHNNKFALHPLFQYFILSIKYKPLLSFSQTAWLVYLGIGLLYSGAKIDPDQLKQFVVRFINCISETKNYDKKPYYLLTAMRVFNEGVNRWRSFIQDKGINELFFQLFRIFFYFDGLSNVAPDDKKFNFCFASTQQLLKKTMKQGIIKSIIYLGKQFPSEFHIELKNESVNQKMHHMYPASVIQVLRQFIKSQRPQNHLVFYVELLLQCLSPMTPNLRKFVQKNALATLQLLCTYNNVSFNQPSQKLSVKTNNHLYIYCLRTSTKWRTINLKDQKPHPDSIVEMSPKGTYIALLSDKLRVWRLSSGFWSGVLGAFSQDWSYQASGKGLKWDQSESSITIIDDNPALNKVIKI